MKPPQLTTEKDSTAKSNGKAKNRNNTGRQTVVFRNGATDEGIQFLRAAGFEVRVSNSFDPVATKEDDLDDVDAIVYPTLGIAIVAGQPNQMAQLQNRASDANSPIQILRDEKVRYALPYAAEAVQQPAAEANFSLEYLQGYQRAFDQILERLTSKGNGKSSTSTEFLALPDESNVTWGLQATRVLTSPFSGRGIRVAILDTGIDFTTDRGGQPRYHPDFEGRTIVTQSFVHGDPSAKDGKGHGTHCIGTACGPRQPTALPRYGIAYESEIFAGKVLNDQGAGADGWIIAGIEWAISRGCEIISLSLGSPSEPGETFDPVFEEVAKRALGAGALIIAAAGNDSDRPDLVKPVGGPANCPSILAVAAVDSDLQVARFSDGGVNPNGGEVNIAAPGVDVFSSFLLPDRNKRLSGTSMATPHVAGIAALHAEANPDARGKKLWDLVVNSASALKSDPRDVGSGLVQAPISETRPGAGREIVMPFKAEETSPIIVGGGGSVGLDFDHSRYVPNGGPGVFASPNEKLTTVQIMHQTGKHLRNFFPEINGNPCIVTIECRNSEGRDSSIRISGGPNGQLSVAFSETDFPMNAAKQLHYGATFKVASVWVEHVVTGATASFNMPMDWAGTILIDN